MWQTLHAQCWETPINLPDRNPSGISTALENYSTFGQGAGRASSRVGFQFPKLPVTDLGGAGKTGTPSSITWKKDLGHFWWLVTLSRIGADLP